MLRRNACYAASVCVALSVAALGQNNQFVLQLPGPASTSGQFFPYPSTLGNPITTSGPIGPVGLSSIIPNPNGNKFYLVGTPGANMLQSADPTFTKLNNVTGLGTQIVKAAAVTPDGKSLLVGTDQDAFYIIDSTTDAAAGSPSIALPGVPDFSSTQFACPSCWIAVSRDSTTAYVLTNFLTGQITKINLSTKQKVATLNLPFGDTNAIALSPLGLLYVSASNVVYEINPAGNMSITSNGTIQLAFNPGALRFTPDGTTFFAANKSPNTTGGKSIVEVTLATKAPAYWPTTPFDRNNPPPLIDDVLVASNSQVFAISSALQTLYDVTPSPLAVGISTLGTLAALPSLVSTSSGAVLSNELPVAHYLYLLVNNGSQYIYRIDLSSNTINTSIIGGLNTGTIAFTAFPPQTGAAGFLTYNANQTLAAGATSQPLIARVLNAAGQPVFNVPVTFTADPTSGFTVSTPGQNTNGDGYVQTTITVPTPAPPPGTYNVTLSAGGVNTTYSILIAGGGGSGGGTGPSQVSIVSGDGQLVCQSTYGADPLTVKVTDTAGNPLPNVQVNFSTTLGSGNANFPVTFTDANGLAVTDFTATSIQVGIPVAFVTINLTADAGPYGTAVFTITQVQCQGVVTLVNINPIAPTIDNHNTITVGEGDVLPAGVQDLIYTSSSISQNVPGVGIRLTDSGVNTPSSFAKCQGSTLSGKDGIAHCDVIGICQPKGTTFPMPVQQMDWLVGDQTRFSGGIVLTAGSSQKVNLTSGDSQTAKTGTVSLPMAATVTDGCDSPASGVTVTWTVTSGSATLLNTKSVSDNLGRVSTQVTFGSTPGAVRVQASLGSSKVVFNLTSTVVIGGITLVSGGGQTAIAGEQFAQPLVFAVRDTGNNPIPGTLVSFSVTSGSAGLNPATQSTNTNGQASTTVTAGGSPGTIVITASAGGSTTTATLTAQPRGPGITSLSFVNADSLAPGLVPCGRATVTGSGITITNLSGVTPLSPLPYVLGGFSLTVNGVAAPIEAVSNVNGVQTATFQTPCETQPGSGSSGATVVATGNGGTTTVSGITVLQAQPGVHSYLGANGKTYGYVICSNGTITPSNLAQRGDTCYVVVTGLGQTNPAAKTNNAGVAGQNVNLQIVVGLNNSGIPVNSAQYLQGWNGFYIVSFTIPKDAPTGLDQPFAIAAILPNGSPVFGNPVFLPGVN